MSSNCSSEWLINRARTTTIPNTRIRIMTRFLRSLKSPEATIYTVGIQKMECLESTQAVSLVRISLMQSVCVLEAKRTKEMDLLCHLVGISSLSLRAISLSLMLSKVV